jgi:hypothetical protein
MERREVKRNEVCKDKKSVSPFGLEAQCRSTNGANALAITWTIAMSACENSGLGIETREHPLINAAFLSTDLLL